MVQILSLTLVFIFYFSYLIKNITLLKQKIKVNQLGKGNNKAKNIIEFETILKILTILMIFIQLFSIIIDDNWYIINIPLFIKIIGLVILLISNIIFILSIIAMKNNWRVGIPNNDNTNLITSGIYKISRNPAFLAFDLLYIGLSLVYPNPLNIIFTILLIIMFDRQIKYEEQYLLKTFKEKYHNYCEKVSRYYNFF